MAEVILIAAIGPDNVIGIKDKMPWHSKQDFYHFKKQTQGWPCIFGEKTFWGLPIRPLRNRLNIVADISQEEDLIADYVIPNDKHKESGGLISVNNIWQALEFTKNYDKVFICGGAGIYKYCLEHNMVDTLYLTKIISPKLTKQFKDNSEDYIRFPVDIASLTKEGWERKVLSYKYEELPEENADITVQFQEWKKIK